MVRIGSQQQVPYCASYLLFCLLVAGVCHDQGGKGLLVQGSGMGFGHTHTSNWSSPNLPGSDQMDVCFCLCSWLTGASFQHTLSFPVVNHRKWMPYDVEVLAPAVHLWPSVWSCEECFTQSCTCQWLFSTTATGLRVVRTDPMPAQWLILCSLGWIEGAQPAGEASF